MKLAIVFASTHLASASAAATYAYESWSAPIKAGSCSQDGTPVSIDLPSKSGPPGSLTCALVEGVKTYAFPRGIFEIDEQLLIPERVSIAGAQDPNDMSNPTKSPDWAEQTLFLATRGATDYLMNYCHAADMVTTRVGFVLSSHVSMRNLSYQGIDTIRPKDNGGLCGGGVFETKGCAENDCNASDVNNGGSDGFGSIGVTIENVRLNDFYHAEDKAKLGVLPEPCCEEVDEACIFCNPNGIRSSQVGVWVPDVRNAEGTRGLFVNNLVSMSNQGDAINLHGNVHDALVQNVHMENTGDDMFVVWGANQNPTNITYKHCTSVNPGIMRPGWYGNCVATYGLKSAVFEDITCRAPTLENPIFAPWDGALHCSTSMYVFFTSFSAQYPEDNSIELKGWVFEDLYHNAYLPEEGAMDQPELKKMAWTRTDAGLLVPYYFPAQAPEINVHVSPQAQSTLMV